MKTFERLVLKYILRMIYYVSYIIPVKQRVVFATYRKDSMQGNFKYIYDELQSKSTKLECKFLYRKFEKGIIEKIIYFLHMMKATYYMATSKHFIIDDFYFPVYIVNKLRKGTEVEQVWHACGAFKKFGFSTLDKNFGANNDYVKQIPIHINYNHVLVTSDEVKKHYAEAFNMSEERIHSIGVPRTDLFFNDKMKEEAKRRILDIYPQLENKKIVLYAPTFRGNSQSDAKMPVGFDMNRVANELPKDYILALKMHPFVRDSVEIKNNKIVDLSDYDVVNDILILTDLLITDYSSIIFEYSLLERPIIFYADDLENYEHERDFYYKYEDFVPGPIVKSTEDIIKVLNAGAYDYEKIKAFKNKFFDYTDGKSSERFVDKIILKKDI